ncbi:hypothetical protein [Phytohabitans houttuyneae]|jgi:hypothetical protein|uniref:DUF1579 domain-containing protein n=1 Tax=Phytohabitans houttuyneae TaxID=1076126 RepID=A0A6V8K1J8_9ACTN|nr:hypothetical protein [Phytohabitans houttuyneae]GFJ76039.1 hypothetical protein Phou_002190 [Phytohabitans houttuyneae]
MADTDTPPDVPDERPAWLDRLDALLGEWDTEAVFDAGFLGPDSAEMRAAGRTSFEWLDGRRFLIQRIGNEHPAFPRAVAVIGAGPERDTFTQRYYDSRGVERLYQMSFDGREWKLWREAPGFSQRYSGLLSPDGGTITGAWEASADGREWRHDFRLTHTRPAT